MGADNLRRRERGDGVIGEGCDVCSFSNYNDVFEFFLWEILFFTGFVL